MDIRKSNNTILGYIRIGCWCFYLIGLISADRSPDPSCPGPTRYYADLKCKPVFKNSDDPCPVKYDCDHLKNLPGDKCIVNGHEYAIGEKLKEEDSNPCDIGCTCTHVGNGTAFRCASVDCFFGPAKPGCYRQHSPNHCCSGPEVCPEKPEDRPTCTVEGKTYKDGEYFERSSEPGKACYCGPGYTDENIESFCKTPIDPCGTMLRHIDDIRKNCIPTYYHQQSPNTSCSLAYRCPNDRDAVIARTSDSSERSNPATSDEPADPDMMCTFGNLRMHVGDQLNQATDYSSVCVKCICQVPPVPTCQRLSDEECDVTEHPNFS